MARMRVHELAKTWEMESKELIAHIERLGIEGKRSQSSLTEDLIERLQTELGLGQPQVSVGKERVKTGETGQQVVERRVGTKVIRRRARAAVRTGCRSQCRTVAATGRAERCSRSLCCARGLAADGVGRTVFDAIAD